MYDSGDTALAHKLAGDDPARAQHVMSKRQLNVGPAVCSRRSMGAHDRDLSDVGCNIPSLLYSYTEPRCGRGLGALLTPNI